MSGQGIKKYIQIYQDINNIIARRPEASRIILHPGGDKASLFIYIRFPKLPLRWPSHPAPAWWLSMYGEKVSAKVPACAGPWGNFIVVATLDGLVVAGRGPAVDAGTGVTVHPPSGDRSEHV